MSELHWTGAALLLALAVIGGSAPRARRDAELTWEEFARMNGINREDERVGPSQALAAPAPAVPPAVAASLPTPASGRTTRLRATATCGHCGRVAGELEWDAAAPVKRA